MKKRLLSVLLILVLAFSLSSCDLAANLSKAIENLLPETLEDEYTYLEVVPETLTYSEGYTPVTSSYSYDILPNEGEKQLYTKVLDTVYDISSEKDETLGCYPMPKIEIDGYTLSEAQVRTVLKALSDDHPEIFWLTGNVGYYSDEDGTVLRTYSRYSHSEVEERVQAVNKVAAEFYATVPDSLSEYSREELVHDFILDTVEYDKSVVADYVDDSEPNDYSTVYGALVHGKAVCEGYTRAFQLLCNGLGLDCVCVIGESEGELHIWNDVKLGDSWYNVDSTWDDQEEPYLRYLNFNITDTELLKNHTYAPLYTELTEAQMNGEDESLGYTASEMNLFIPHCDDDTMTYYYRKTPHLSDYNAADVKSGLLSSAEKQDSYFLFYIDYELDYDEAVSSLFTDYPQHFFSYVDDVNWNLSSYSIDSSNMSYFELSEVRSVAVMLNYY